jgi:hypothetical protein
MAMTRSNWTKTSLRVALFQGAARGEGDGGLPGERLHEQLVVLAERALPGPLGQIKGAEHLLLVEHRHAEERRHPDVRVGETDRAWVLVEPVEPDGALLAEYGAEKTPALGQVRHPPRLRDRQPFVHEMRDRAGVEDGSGAVPSLRCQAREIDRLLEDRFGIPLRRDRDERIEEELQRGATGVGGVHRRFVYPVGSPRAPFGCRHLLMWSVLSQYALAALLLPARIARPQLVRRPCANAGRAR